MVLLAAGWVVNRAASRSLEETLGPRDEQRLELAVTIVEEALERGVEGRPLRFLLQRIAGESGGMVRVVDASGAVVAEAGRMPPRTTETESLTRDLAAVRRRRRVRAGPAERAGTLRAHVQRRTAADRDRHRGGAAHRRRLRRRAG